MKICKFILFFICIFNISFAVERNYSAVVAEVETGKILYEKDAKNFRYPASLTKIMTSYLVFEALKKNKIKLSDKIKISKKAASAVRTNLDLKEGEVVSLEDLLKGMLVISANDAPIAIAEKIAGSEERFVRMMNEKAQKMGLSSTVFMNSNGLHNPKQFTTAEDLSMLARKIISDFPEFLPLFSLKEFEFKGRIYKSTNNLLFVNENIFGLKTGFINASGYNLISIQSRNEKKIIAILMHIDERNIRDEFMLKLLNYSFEKAQQE